ncbi:hypothetical protein AB5L52_45465 (plasmid) [Streptomyces sp. CG4]|uniref:hypothetical protein n=1 Tax=Streptomyces sp. CG4 TaxID=408783 RepID=UPI0034E1F705
MAGYAFATWAGLEEEAFTVEELLDLASEVAGGQQCHHLVALQMVMASAPLHGWELPGMVDQELGG